MDHILRDILRVFRCKSLVIRFVKFARVCLLNSYMNMDEFIDFFDFLV